MENIVYLKNGEEVILHKALEDSQFVIEKLCVYSGYDGDDFTEPCGVKEVVNEVFTKPPIGKKNQEFIKVNKEFIKVNKELKEVETQLRLAKNDLRKVKDCKTNLEKHIINRSELLNAKSITFFCGYEHTTIKKDEDKESLNISYSVDILEGKIDSWVCALDWEGRSSYTDYINPKYGLILDATEEEIVKIGKQIVRDMEEIEDWDLKRIPDAYLTKSLRKRKIKILEDEKMLEISKQEKIVKKEIEILEQLKK